MIDSYREYLYSVGLSEQTIRNYTSVITRVEAWCRTLGYNILALRPSEMRAVAANFVESPSVRGQLRSALQHYWTYHDVTGPAGSILIPSAVKPKWRGIEDDETQILLEEASKHWPAGGAVYLGVYLGLRRAEIASLRWSDFRDEFTWVRVMGKGSKLRDIPVHPFLRDFLLPQQWPGEWVFPARIGKGHVHPNTVIDWVAEVSLAAGLPRLTPHQLRHVSGGKVLFETGELRTAQEWLGHSRSTTTEIYTRTTKHQLLAAMAALDWQGVIDVSDVSPSVREKLGKVVLAFVREHLEEIVEQVETGKAA